MSGARSTRTVGKYRASIPWPRFAEKGRNEVDDDTLILADVSRKAIDQMTTVTAILDDGCPGRAAAGVPDRALDSDFHHRRPARALGLEVGTDVPAGLPA